MSHSVFSDSGSEEPLSMFSSPQSRTGADSKRRTRTKTQSTTPIFLQQLQYRSYKYTADIYHYSQFILPIDFWKNTVTIYDVGYQHSLIGVDPLHDLPVVDGDEIPPGRLEVIYLPNVFHRNGSAIGIRNHTRNEIEWLCFRCLAAKLIEEAQGPRGEPLFDKVAYLEKGGKGEKGNAEHRALFESIEDSRRKYVKLKLILRDENGDIVKKRQRGLIASPSSKEVSPDRDFEGSGLRIRFKDRNTMYNVGLSCPFSSPRWAETEPRKEARKDL